MITLEEIKELIKNKKEEIITTRKLIQHANNPKRKEVLQQTLVNEKKELKALVTLKNLLKN